MEERETSLVTHTILLDTDIGDDIDDALALALALRSPEIAIKAVTTVFGDTQQRARLAAHVLHTFGHDDIPVAAGLGTPLQPRQRPSGVPQAALLDNRTVFPAISSLTAPELIIQTALAYPRQLTLVCIGPLTNIARALTLEPRLFMSIRNIVVMGGSSGPPLAEWNIRNDVLAARIVLGAGVPVSMISWNISWRCQLRHEDLERIRQQPTELMQLLSKLIAIWQRHRPRRHSPLPYLHDPLTITALCRPDLLRFEEIPVRIIEQGPLQGFMIARMLNGPWVRATTDVDVEQTRTWIMQRLVGEDSQE